MYEVERKLRVPHEQVRPALDEEWFVGRVRQRDTYFDHPSRAFARSDEALRVRWETVLDGTDATPDRLTYKGPRLEAAAKSRRELETDVGDADEIVTILQALDFQPAGVVEKTRERYRTDGCDVVLDAVESLGEFVEIEARGATEDVEEGAAAIDRVIDRIDLDDAETVKASYLALVLDA